VHFKANKEAHTTPTYKRKESLKSLLGPHDKTNTFDGSFASTTTHNETCLSSALTPFLQPSLVLQVIPTHTSAYPRFTDLGRVRRRDSYTPLLFRSTLYALEVGGPVVVATRHGMDGSRFVPCFGTRDFLLTRPDRPRGPPGLLCVGTVSIPWG
jgi:hypothetical protein